MDLTSKQRAYLKSLSGNIDPIFQIGKASLTPAITSAIDDALEKRELVKIAVLKNCLTLCRSLENGLFYTARRKRRRKSNCRRQNHYKNGTPKNWADGRYV